jgi:hypothetical protein
MSFFKDPQNNLHFLDDDAFEYLLPVGCVQITDEAAAAIQASIAAAAAAESTKATQIAQAQAALDKSDITFLRAQEAGQAWQAAWVAYRVALRLVVKAGGDLPTLPATYPDGTPTA